MPIEHDKGKVDVDEESYEYVVRLLARRARNALARAKTSLQTRDYDGSGL